MGKSNRKKIIGYSCILGAAFLAYLSAVVVRWSEARTDLHPAFFLFSQCALGFVFISTLLFFKKERPQPDRFFLVVGRAIGSVLAILFLYKAVTVTTVAAANILNLTYPLFIGLFTYLFFKDKRDPYSLVSVLFAWGGVWLILAPGGIELQMGNLWGLASGVSAALAVMFLNLARERNDSESILYYMFGIGALFVFIIYPSKIHMPNRWEAYYLGLATVSGIAGQYMLTVGHRFVTAVEGSVLSSTRIIMAGFLGPILVADKALGVYGWTGALLIFAANTVIAVRKAKQGK